LRLLIDVLPNLPADFLNNDSKIAEFDWLRNIRQISMALLRSRSLGKLIF